MRGSARPRPPATVPTFTTQCVGMTARHTTTAVSWDASKLHQNDVTYHPRLHQNDVTYQPHTHCYLLSI